MNISFRSFQTLILFLFIVNISSAQVYEKGNVIIDGYYGFPNLMFSKWKSLVIGDDRYSMPTSFSIGPVGGRLEFMLSKKIGIGLEGSYSHTEVNYFFQDTYSNSDDPYKVSINRFRILPRFNFHFGKSTKFDPYVAGGIGYYYRSIVFTPDNPGYGYNPNSGFYETPKYPFGTLLFPIALTAKFGMRYFLNDRIGLGMEVGFGGPIVTFGLTAKFP